MTLETINGGVIWVDGEPLTHVERNGGLVPADARASAPHPRQDRHGVPALQSVPAHDGAEELHGGAVHGAEAAEDEAEARARELLAMVGLGDKLDHYPEPAVRRPAAARRDRPRARHAAEGDAVRRGDLGARPGARRRGAERHPQARRGARPHHADGHPPDGLRQGIRRPRLLLLWRPDRRARAARRRSSARRRTSAPGSS